MLWAGRYPVSRAVEPYITSERESLLTFRSDDPGLSDRLFERLVAEIGQSA
jgi:hypothetical protein